jgi:cell division protein WhiA
VSLSEDVRGELAVINPSRACCRLAELSALARTAGTLRLRSGGRVGVHVQVASAAVARRAFSLLRAYGVRCEIATYRRRAFDRSPRFRIDVGEGGRALQALNEAGIVGARAEPLQRPPARVVARACCRAAYVRGALLAAGSISGPPAAHLELRTADAEGARFLAQVAAADGFTLAVGERRDHALAYAKSTDTIADLLAFVGASEGALRLRERAVVAATRERANRLANADHGNIGRTAAAAEAQLRAVERLRADGRLGDLAPELRELAELRTRHPTLSLRELAGRCRPPATKAAAHRRLTKLRRLADG